MNSPGKAMLGAGLGAVGQVGGELLNKGISGSLSSGAGNGISSIGGTVGNVLSNINPVIGGIVSLGSGIIGGAVNRLWGASFNQEHIDEINESNKAMNNVMVDSSSNANILAQWGAQDFGKGFNKSYIGKDGVWSNKVANKFKSLQQEQTAARNRALASFTGAANIADTNIDNMALASYAAFGGPIGLGEGAIGYDFLNRELEIRKANALAKQRVTSMPNSFLSHDFSTFALGGNMNNFNNGITQINNGGTHEQNPLTGVPMGVDSQGIPNLVEEGEVIYNDYVFSNRINVPKAIRSKYKLRSADSISFADAAKKLQKESEERPNDPISKNGLDVAMYDLQQAQEEIRMKRAAKKLKDKVSKMSDEELLGLEQQLMNSGVISAHGGKLYRQGGSMTDAIAEVLTPYIQTHYQTIGNFKPTLPDTPTEDLLMADLPELTIMPEDTVTGFSGTKSPKGLEFPSSSLSPSTRQALVPGLEIDKDIVQQALDLAAATKDGAKNKNPLAALQAVPVFSNLAGVLQNVFTKPDYSRAEAIERAADRITQYAPVSYTPTGTYLSYEPFDTLFYTNKLGEQAAATRSAIKNQSNNNRAAAVAGLVASDKVAQEQLGDLARKAAEYDRDHKEKVATFNNAIDARNAEMGLKAAMANQDAYLSSYAQRLKGIASAMALKDQIDQNRANALNTNLTNLSESLAGIGRQAASENMININDAFRHLIDSLSGTLGTKRNGGKLNTNRNRRKKHG